MKKCNSCNVSVNTLSSRCPVCGSKLSGKEVNNIYPKPKKKKTTAIMKYILFLSFVIGLICLYIDYISDKDFTWSLYVLLSLLTNYIVLANINKSHQDRLSLLEKYGFIIVLLLFTWYYFTKFNVITNYVIPGFCIFELLFTDIMAITVKHKYIKKYLRLVVSNIGLSFIPIILMLFNLTTFDYLAHISLILSLINIAGLIIFDLEDLKDAIDKLLNY